MQLQPEKNYLISGQAIQAIVSQPRQLPRHTEQQCRAIEGILSHNLVETPEPTETPESPEVEDEVDTL